MLNALTARGDNDGTQLPAKVNKTVAAYKKRVHYARSRDGTRMPSQEKMRMEYGDIVLCATGKASRN